MYIFKPNLRTAEGPLVKYAISIKNIRYTYIQGVRTFKDESSTILLILLHRLTYKKLVFVPKN